jgi:tetratricopeptide (TPR) repeat protein
MNPAPTLRPQELAQLVHHLHNKGKMALQMGNSNHAHIWFAQCLSVLKQIGNNEDFISQVLFYLGQTRIYFGETQQVIAFCEAAANIQKRQGQGEPEADCFYAAGSCIADFGDYPKAFKVFSEALRIYERIDATKKVNLTKRELDKLSGQIKDTDQPDEPLEFAIYVEGQVLDKITVSPEGEVKWHDLTGFSQAVVMGAVRVWQVVCTKYPYRQMSF